MKKSYLVAAMLAIGCLSYAQEQTPVKGNYRLAARYSPKKLSKLIFSLTVEPHWLKLSDKCWYEYETSQGKNWYIADPVLKTKQLLFDKAILAAQITRIMQDPFDAEHLPIENLRFSTDEKSITFQIKSSLDETVKPVAGKKPSTPKKKSFYFRYTLATQKLETLSENPMLVAPPAWAAISPDGQKIIFSRNHNLYMIDKAGYAKALENELDSSVVETPLTTDGVEYYSYAAVKRGDTDTQKEKTKNERKAVTIYWSPDSKYFYLIRADERHVKDLWVIHSITEGRPELETYKYQMAGEKENAQKEIQLFDVAAKTSRKIATGLFKDQELTPWEAPKTVSNRDDVIQPVIWQGTNSKFYFSATSRDLKKVDLCMAEVASGKVTSLIQERFNTYIDIARVELVNGSDELIYWSEADGWSHFYLYDGNGKLKNQITTGQFHCQDAVKVDEKNRLLYFTANGREEGEDPYYLHFYRVKLDGTGLTLMNKGNFDHAVGMNDHATFFVNNFSRVNTVPESVLYDNNGRKVMDLEKADLSALLQTGYKFPTPNMVKADDGITNLYGVMYTPFDFDSTKKYPVIEFVYPGPQTEYVNKSWTSDTRYPAGVFSMDRTARLAQLGFVVVTIGNRGGHPTRSKWYHTYGYGNLRDYGLADKKAAIEQLADRYSFVDITRVGITGRSGGGFMSTAAMLVYPDFFKAAVAEVGNHENNIYNRWWSEKHHGVKEVITDKGDTTYQYAIDKNPELAKNLKGNLLLALGDIDNNVHPAGTIRMANSLIKANKRFDFVIMPGERHVFTPEGTEYFFYMMGDYFVKHFLGDYSQPVDILELQREQPQNGKVTK
jgi:dipeptidyl-peptidase-4